MKISKFSQLFWDLLFPVSCLGCQKPGAWLCPSCLDGIKTKSYQPDLVLEKQYLDQVIVAASYDNQLLQQALHCFKYKFVKSLGGQLAELIELAVVRQLKSSIFIPIPIHPRRQRYREFNQAQILAEALAQKYQLKVEDEILKRIKSAAPQMSLGRAERLVNIKNVFAVSKAVAGKELVLVDDVVTTGATLNEAARMLKQAGAKSVIGLAIAHRS